MEDLDPEYMRRRDELAAMATGPDAPPATIDYTELENRTWQTARRALRERWRTTVVDGLLRADQRIDLPIDRIPQLQEVTDALAPRTGFAFHAVPGLVPVQEFFGALAEGRFLSTQYVRHHASPLYTSEPDIIHEVLGHGTCLANPHLSLVHRAAGAAMLRLETEAARQFLADVFWFSAEFGVIQGGDGPLEAYGAGILSSVGELDNFRRASVRPIDVTAMGATRYRIDEYQPALFAARSLAHVVDVIGEFFATASDDSISALQAVAA